MYHNIDLTLMYYDMNQKRYIRQDIFSKTMDPRMLFLQLPNVMECKLNNMTYEDILLDDFYVLNFYSRTSGHGKKILEKTCISCYKIDNMKSVYDDFCNLVKNVILDQKINPETVANRLTIEIGKVNGTSYEHSAIVASAQNW